MGGMLSHGQRSDCRFAHAMTRRFLAYTFFVAAAVAAVAGLIQLGTARLSAPGVQAAAAPAQSAGPLAQMLDNARLPLPRLVIQLIVVLVAAQVLGILARRLRQPRVIGEIAAGVMLGPSLLGWAAPDAAAFLFPPGSLPTLQLLSQVGVLLFMFVVGLELDPGYLRGKARTAIVVSHVSIIVPFTLGVALSLALYSRYAPAGVPFHSFALFCGIAMSITAFPVLARILEDRHLTHTPLGTTAITCAAVDDVTAWSILAFVVAVTTAAGAVETLIAIVALSCVFVLVMIFVVRPVLQGALDPDDNRQAPGRARLAVALLVMLASSLVTEIIGIHALFGAFIAGAIMPAGTFRSVLRDRIEGVGAVLLLPLFFVYTGLRTQIGLLDSVASWAICLAIVLVATAGKLGGTAAAARWTGLSWPDSVALGALMNTRGLMELVALNVGYDLGILTPEIFTMLVLMALVTTAMTGPLLSSSLRQAVDYRPGLASARSWH